jgi:hypothetical protein
MHIRSNDLYIRSNGQKFDKHFFLKNQIHVFAPYFQSIFYGKKSLDRYIFNAPIVALWDCGLILRRVLFVKTVYNNQIIL